MSAAARNAVAARQRMTGRVVPVSLPLRHIPEPPEYAEHTTRDGRRVFISDRVLDHLTRLERAHHPDETAGLLFGRYFTDGQRPCTVVTDLVGPQPGDVIGSPSAVTITVEGAKSMHSRARRATPCADPVGWAHTHPRFPAFFSAPDGREQRAWTESSSVGLVLSGLRDATEPYRVFVGPEATPAERTTRSASFGPHAGREGTRLRAPTDSLLPHRELAGVETRLPAAALHAPVAVRVDPYARRAVALLAFALVLLAISLLSLWLSRNALRQADAAAERARAAEVAVARLRRIALADTATIPQRRRRARTSRLSGRAVGPAPATLRERTHAP